MTAGRRRSPAILAAASACALALAACEQQPEASAVNTQAPAADRAPEPLMGAPERPAPTAEVPPPERSAPAPGAVVAMRPIPNPGDPGAEPYYAEDARGAGARRVHHRYPMEGGSVALAAPGAAPAHSHRHRAAGLSAGAAAAAGATALIRHHPAAPRPAPARPLAANTAPKAPPTASAPAATGSRAERIDGLKAVLADALAKGAVLRVPERFVLGSPNDVVLTVPAAFNNTLIAEAKSRGLQDEAAAASLSAVLNSEGYGVMPAEPQSVLVAGDRSSEFRWTVVQHDKTAAPLKANVTATLLGGGTYPMDLGSVAVAKPADGGGSLRVVGGVVLILLGALAAAWLARGRGRPPTYIQRPAETVRRQPLDMSKEADPRPPEV